jgi:hypothetical protein
MAIDAKDILAKLSKERREAIKARTEELIAEEMGLAQLRNLLKQSQAGLAKRMRVQQAEVSKIERRGDMYVSTLRRYIEAAGGSLELVVRIPNQKAVHIKFQPAPGPKRAAARSRIKKSLAAVRATKAPPKS